MGHYSYQQKILFIYENQSFANHWLSN